MKPQIADIMANERQKLSKENRQVDSLIAILLKIAQDLKTGKAVELDFNIDVEELNNFDEINLTLQTLHKKPEPPKPKSRLIIPK